MVLTMVKKPEARVQASEFKARCLELMDRVARTGRPIVITKHGKPLAQLAPLPGAAGQLLGLHRGAVEITGDILAPLDAPWEAAR